MTAAVAGTGRAWCSRARLVRVILGAVVVAIGACGVLVAGSRLATGLLPALLFALRLLPVVVAVLVGLMIVSAVALTPFRAYLSIALVLFVTEAATGVSTRISEIAAPLGHAMLVVAVFAFLPIGYFFPDGRTVPARTRLLLPAWVLLAVLPLTASWDPLPAGLLLAIGALGVPLLLSVVASQIWRYRHVSGPVERQQTKWLLVALTLEVAHILAVMLFPPGSIGRDPVITAVFGVTGPLVMTALPVSIGFAMLRYRLFEVDLLIGRALVLGAVTAFVIGVTAAVVGFAGLAWPDGTPPMLPAAAAAAAAAGAVPLHRWVRGTVNRRLYGARDDPAAVLERLADELSVSGELAPTLLRVAGTLQTALRLDAVAVVATDAAGREAARAETPRSTGIRPGSAPAERAPSAGASTVEEVVLAFEGRPVGLLRVVPRPGERLRPAERETVRRIAAAAGVAVHAALVTDELRRSRGALVAAREEERSRLHRELHDGIGPTLASVSQRLGGVQSSLTEDPARAVRMLESAQQGVADALTELRGVVAGLRPPALAQRDLVAALRAAWPADAAPTVRIDGDPQTLPPVVETAAYRIAMEAIGNAVRHGGASLCRVQVSRDHAALRLRIDDDGIGGAAESPAGAGLRTMRERAEALGGSLRVEQRRPGTRIDALLPLDGTV